MKDSDWVATFLTSRWQAVDRAVKPGESTYHFLKLLYTKAIRTKPISNLVTVTIFLSIVRLERQYINMAIEENPQNYLETREQWNAMLKWKLLITGFWNLLWGFFPLPMSQGEKKAKLWHRKDLKWIQMGHCMTRWKHMKIKNLNRSFACPMLQYAAVLCI